MYITFLLRLLLYREEKRVQYVWLNSQIKMRCKYTILKSLHNTLDAISLLETRADNYYHINNEKIWSLVVIGK